MILAFPPAPPSPVRRPRSHAGRVFSAEHLTLPVPGSDLLAGAGSVRFPFARSCVPHVTLACFATSQSLCPPLDLGQFPSQASQLSGVQCVDVGFVLSPSTLALGAGSPRTWQGPPGIHVDLRAPVFGTEGQRCLPWRCFCEGGREATLAGAGCLL